MVVAAVHPDVFPLHEAKVGEEVELRGLAGLGVLACPGTRVLGLADRAVKIKDGRRLIVGRQVEVKKRHCSKDSGSRAAPACLV